MLALVANTGRRWYDYLSSIAIGGWLDEVNFWRPQSQLAVRAVSPGAPFFLRLKRPINAVPFHARSVAGVRAEERRGDVRRVPRTDRVISGRIDLRTRPGDRLRMVLQRQYETAEEFTDHFTLVECDTRTWCEVPTVQREGQGSFRVRLLGAYQNRCAITGERTIPVLDAAHIQPYLAPASNHVQNGLVLRSDLHELFDDGYLTVTPQLVVEVSRRIREEYENGREYYRFHGSRLTVVPDRIAERPSVEALTWHAENVYR